MRSRRSTEGDDYQEGEDPDYVGSESELNEGKS